MDIYICFSFNENKVQGVIGNSMIIASKFLQLERKIKVQWIKYLPNQSSKYTPQV
jgi:hypothetical protein